MPQSIGVSINNPGDLTVNPNNPYAYSDYGQTGVYSSPNGLSYPEFGTPQQGANALQDYITNNIGTNPNTSLSSLSQFASYFLNGSYDALTNTAANPHATDFLTALENATGLSANDNFTQSDIKAGLASQIAQGVSKGEGTYAAFGNLYGGNVTNGILTNVVGAADGLGKTIQDVLTGNLSGAVTSAVNAADAGGAAAAGAAGSALAGLNVNLPDIAGAVNSVGSSLQSFVSWIEGVFSINTAQRATAVIIGVILAVIAVAILIAENKTVQQVVQRVPIGA